MIRTKKKSSITKRKIDDIIHQLQVQPTKDNLLKFRDIVGSGIEQNLNFRFIAEKAKIILKVDDLNTWSFLLDYFEHKGQVYPAICCAEDLLAECNTEVKERYVQLQAIYNNKKKEELAFVQKTFKKNPPKFCISVIIPTYNRHQYIGRAIKSVLNQTFKDFELIIINDGGSRECEATIESFKSDKIRYFYIEHGGLSNALNQGILTSRSKYIAYLDDDDHYFPEHLQILVKTLESSSYPFVYSDSYRIVKKYKNGKWSQVSKAIDISNDYNPALLTERNYIPILNAMHRRDCLEQIGLFEEDFPNVMDWDLWYKASRFYDFKHINKVTSEFEHRLDSDSSLSGRQLDHLFYSILLYKHHQYLMKHVWNNLISERSDLKFLNYIELENKISRYSKDELQLGEWLLPYAFAERKFFHAYKLVRQMILNNFKKAFTRVWKIVPKISILNKIIILLFIFLSLSEKFFKYLAFNITSMFREIVRLKN